MSRDTVRFSVDLESPIAVYVQIENQIQFAITSGKIKGGELLPSVREMSSTLGVNPNTVTKAYRDLELLGLVNTRRGVGVTITPDAQRRCRNATLAMVERHLFDAVAECVAAGFSHHQVRAAVKEALDNGYTPYGNHRKS